MHSDLNKSVTSYPTVGDSFTALSFSLFAAIPMRIAQWIGFSTRGIIVSPMSQDWLRQHNEHSKKK